MQIAITYSDNRVETVSIAPGDLVRFERHFGMPASKLGGDNTGVEHVTFLAWASLTRNGLETRDFDTFLNDLADVSGVTDSPPLPPPGQSER